MVTVGIIGAGRIGKVHTESICNYVRNARIKTVADPFLSEATEQWLKSMGVEAKGMVIFRIISTAAHSMEDVNRTLAAFTEVRAKLDAGYYDGDEGDIVDMATR